jgi:hypothetical protein
VSTKDSFAGPTTMGCAILLLLRWSQCHRCCTGGCCTTSALMQHFGSN